MKLPKLDYPKCITIEADDATGKVLNNDGSFYNSTGDDYYRIFDHLQLARQYAKSAVKHRSVEVVIYDGFGRYIEIHRS